MPSLLYSLTIWYSQKLNGFEGVTLGANWVIERQFGPDFSLCQV